MPAPACCGRFGKKFITKQIATQPKWTEFDGPATLAYATAGVGTKSGYLRFSEVAFSPRFDGHLALPAATPLLPVLEWAQDRRRCGPRRGGGISLSGTMRSFAFFVFQKRMIFRGSVVSQGTEPAMVDRVRLRVCID